MSTIKQEEIDIEAFSDERFDLEKSVSEAKEIIDEMVSQNKWLEGDFENDVWGTADNVNSGHMNRFDFNPLNTFIFNKEVPKEFKEMVKCWVVSLIQQHADATGYYSRFIQCFNQSKGFKKSEVTNLIQYIENHDSKGLNKFVMIHSVCNFFDYTDLEIADDYTPSLLELKAKIPIKASVRQLPSSKYVLKFSYYLENDFERLVDKSFEQTELEKELLLVYPLIIWWRLTNIIPLRANEFASIQRDCLFTKDDKHYIRLPRSKQKNPKRIQILDKLLIDSDLFELITRYIEMTNRFGKTDTLISFRSICYAEPHTARETKTHDLNRFKRNQLNTLIKGFYRKLNEKYDYTVEPESQLLPNDTRHFAFISLMMQGYSPVEIARLGGHQTIQAQYHYSGHTEYWVDCEVFKLMKNIKSSKIVSEETAAIPNEVKLKAFDNSYNGFKRKMKIGYCKDEEQRCQSKKCFFCPYWGISSDEFLEKKEEIRTEIITMKNNVNELAATLHNLNKQFLADELSRRNPEHLTGMKTKANKIQSELHKLALLCSKLGEGGILNDKISWT